MKMPNVPMRVTRCLIVIALLAAPGLSPVRAAPGYVPIYTSPIDVTGLSVVLRASAPDRDTGKPVNLTLPAGLLGPMMGGFLTTPLSTQFDNYWNRTDPKTGTSPRASACDGEDGIKAQVIKQIATLGSSYSAYDVSCDLASSGQLIAKQNGSSLLISYLLTKNSVSFTSTSPFTCHAGENAICPHDPRYTVRFATELTTEVRTAGLCQIFASDGTVNVVAASIDGHNAAATIGKFIKDQRFVAAEIAMTKIVSTQKLPLEADFAELRNSAACTGKVPGVAHVLAAFPNVAIAIEPRTGIVLQVTHVGIAAPALDGPGFSGGVPYTPVPSFARPTISTTQPIVTAGVAVQTIGQYFPASTRAATFIPVSVRHGGYNGSMGYVCSGPASGTLVDSGPVGGARRVVQLAGDERGNCASEYDAANLVPDTNYAFRARDCDPITCSPWSTTIVAKTAKSDVARGNVILTLDTGTPLGTATVDAHGKFQSSVTVPVGTPPGPHTIHAVDADLNADVAIGVIAPPVAGTSDASIVMVAQLPGESGCPNHPIVSTVTDNTFMLFGTRFAAGTVTIRLDTAAGATLGSATVRPDGTFCGQMVSAPRSLAGPHKLLAVQNGAVATAASITFVTPTFVR